MEIDQEKIQEAIVAAAVERVLEESDLAGMVRKAITEKINSLFAEQAKVQIEAAVSTIIEDGLNREYRRADGFGIQDSAPPTTIRKELEKALTGFWKQKVDRYGKPTESDYDSAMRMDRLMAQIAGDEFGKLVSQNVANAAGPIKDMIRTEMKKAVDNSLGKIFRVISANDEEEKRPHG